MTDAAGLLVRIEATTAKLRAELARAERATGAAASGIDRHAARAEKAIDALGRSLVGVAAGVSLGNIGADIIRTVTTFEKLDARIRNMTGSQAAFAEAQNYLSQTASALNVDLETLTRSYSGLLSAQEAGNITQEQGRKILEGLTDASAALGADTHQLGLVFFGLNQALGSVNVQFDEIKQVTDPLPGLLGKIAAAAGMTSGEFKELVSEGKVTADAFSGYLITALEDYQGASAGMADTVSASWVRLGNAWTELKRQLQEPIQDVLTPLLRGATSYVQRMKLFTESWMEPDQKDWSPDLVRSARDTNLYRQEYSRQRIAALKTEGMDSKAWETELTALEQVGRELDARLSFLEGRPPDQGPPIPTAASDKPAPVASAGKSKGKKSENAIETLKAERAELSMTSRERAISTALRKLDTEATEAQKAQARELAGAIYDEAKALEVKKAVLERAGEVAQKNEDAQAASSTLAKKIIADRWAMDKALQDEHDKQKQLLGLSGETERSRRIEIALMDEKAKRSAAGVPLIGQEIVKTRELIAAITDMEMARETIEELGATIDNSLNQNLADSLAGVQSWGDGVKKVLATVLNATLDALGQMSGVGGGKAGIGSFIAQGIMAAGSAYFGSSAGVTVGTGGGSVRGGTPFAGKRAAGGPVDSGLPYLVGEKGPELFVPRLSGSIVPNHKMGGNSVTIHMPIDARGADPGAAERLRAVAGEIARNTQAQIMDQINRGGGAARITGRRR